MGINIPESLSKAFQVAAKVGVTTLRAGAVIGGAVIAGAGGFALTQNFMNQATDAAAYVFPLLTIPFGLGMAAVGAVPQKVLSFIDNKL